MRHEQEGRIDWPLTLRNGIPTSRDALVRRVRKRPAGELWVFVVDASASTRRNQALSQAKGLLRSLLLTAYQHRIQIALVEASGTGPSWRVSGKRPPKFVDAWLESMGAGGGTPLAEALSETRQFLKRRDAWYPRETRQLFLFTDGRVREIPVIEFDNINSVLIDIETGPIRLGRSRHLAESIGATYVHIETLPEQ